MDGFSDELRLALVALLNAGVFAAAFRLARRFGGGGAVQSVCDAFLLYLLTQYAAVGLPGACGVFNLWTMTAVASAAGVGMWLAAGRAPPGEPGLREEARIAPRRARGRVARPDAAAPPPAPGGWDADRLGLLGCALFVAGFLGVYAWGQLPLPPFATDALVYHLPTAVHWIQTHRLGLYPTWYWNPAASYSPGTGAIFMAWWMAPPGNDVFVRFVQIPPLLFLFFLVVRACRVLGCRRTVAGLVGVAAALSRPLFSESIFPKDDLYVTAFVTAAVLALSGPLPRGGAGPARAGPIRAGIALGFVLASKYTVLLACPVFLFSADAPFRARWRARHWLTALGIAAAMALPWYVRNAVLTGNPLYPVDVHLAGLHLPGLFGTERDRQLRTGGGVWKMLSSTYHSLPAALIVLLAAGWASAWGAGRAVWRDALPRAAVIGSAATLLLFLATSPHHEVRYLFPLIVLWFVAAALGISRALRRPALQIGAAALLALASTATSFSFEIARMTLSLTGWALLLAALGVGAVLLQTRRLRLGRGAVSGLAGLAVAAMAVAAYVQWHAYVQRYRETRFEGWGLSFTYPRYEPLWKWVDEHVPADAAVAYANTYFVYPYYGFNLGRRVGYAPTRRGLHDFRHFPKMGDRVPGDELVRRMTEVMDADPDPATWRQNLAAMGAGWLVVMKYDEHDPDLSREPPEMKLARAEPGVFVPAYEDEAGVVYRIGPATVAPPRSATAGESGAGARDRAGPDFQTFSR